MTDINLWNYFKDRTSISEALEHYYADLLKDNTELQSALAMIKNGERVIDSIMLELQEESDE